MMALRWLLYLIHEVIYVVYSLLQFLSKPGTRFVVPILFVALSALYLRPALHHHFNLPLDFDNIVADIVDAVTFVVLVVICWVYVYLSRSLGLVLGIFPPVARPLQPIDRLRGTSDTVRAVVVRLAVPALAGAGAAAQSAPAASAKAEPIPRRQRLTRHGPVVRWVVLPALALAGVAVALGAGLFAIGKWHEAAVQQRQLVAQEIATGVARAHRQQIFDRQYALARVLVAGGVSLNEERLSCDLHNNNQPTLIGDDVARQYVELAQAPTVVFFVHGLNLNSKDGWDSMAEARAAFADAAAAIGSKATGPIALCYVRWPALRGFGTGKTDYLDAALLSLVRMWNLDDVASIDHVPHHLLLVGYSAGGNLTAQAVLNLYDSEDKAALKHPQITLLTIGTPHQGADPTTLASSATGGVIVHQAVSLVAGIQDMLGVHRDGTDAMSRIGEIVDAEGIKQISPNNPDLAALSGKLEDLHSRAGDLVLVNLYSSRDAIVTMRSSAWDFADRNDDLADTGVRHEDFMQAPAGGRMFRELADALSVSRLPSTVQAPPAVSPAAGIAPTPGGAQITAPPRGTSRPAESRGGTEVAADTNLDNGAADNAPEYNGEKASAYAIPRPAPSAYPTTAYPNARPPPYYFEPGAMRARPPVGRGDYGVDGRQRRAERPWP